MSREDKRQSSNPIRKEIKKLPNKGKDEKRIDFNICPYSPYGKFGIWFKAIWRI